MGNEKLRKRGNGNGCKPRKSLINIATKGIVEKSYLHLKSGRQKDDESIYVCWNHQIFNDRDKPATGRLHTFEAAHSSNVSSAGFAVQ